MPVYKTGRVECLAVNPGKEILAAVLEPVRYAAIKQATMSVFTFSGLTLEGPHSLLLATKSIEGGHLQKSAPGSKNTTKSFLNLESNPCGCLMAVNLDEDYSATEMMATDCGIPASDDHNNCSTENISNPASIAYVQPLNGMVIAEDSKNHENNAVWLHHAQSKSLTRIFTAPVKGALTGINWFQVLLHAA